MTNPAEYLAQVERQLSALDEELDTMLQPANTQDTQEAMVDRAADGEYGRTWQIVAERIKDGETTLEAVFDGTDTSPEAEELRAEAQERAEELGLHLQESEDEDLLAMRAEAAQEREEFLARIQRLRAAGS